MATGKLKQGRLYGWLTAEKGENLRIVKSILRKILLLLGLEVRRRRDIAGQHLADEYRPRRQNGIVDMEKEEVNIYRYAQSGASEKINSFKEKIIAGVYSTCLVPCALCGNRDEWLYVASAKEGFKWAICKKCGLFQMNCRLPHDQLNQFYQSGEYKAICLGGNDEVLFALEHEVQALSFLDILARVGIEVANMRIAEIGCGSGGILLAMKERGAIVKGFDLDDKQVALGRRYLTDSEIVVSDALDIQHDLSSYDFILLSNVIEHLFDPQKFINDLRKKMESGDGKVLIAVPNLEGAHAYQPTGGKSDSFVDFLSLGHIWYFTSISLERMLNQGGFKVDFLLNAGSSLNVICSKCNEAIQNINNSFSLSVSSINYANYKRDRCNVGVAQNQAVQRVFAPKVKEIVKKSQY